MDSILIPSTYSWLDCPDNFNCLLDYLNFLKKETQEKLKINISSKLIQAIVVPHAGLRYSGLCSMSAYLPASNNKKIKKIIILSTDHHDKLKSGVYTDNFYYLDKLNNKYSITSDSLTTKLLSDYHELFEKRNIQDEIGKEHSLLNQLPFISYLFKDSVTVIPIVVGTDNLESISKILFKIINKTTLVVCNTDFSHVNGRFKNKVNINIYDEIRKKDSNMLKFLFKKNNIDFNKAYVENNDYSLCGYTAINLLKKILRLTNSYKKTNRTKTNRTNKNIKNRFVNNNTNKSRKNKNNNKNNIIRLFPRISSYYTSLQLSNFIDFSKPLKLNDMTKRFVISDTNESSVSYIGIVFTRKIPDFKRPLPYLLSNFEKAALVQYSMHCVLNEVLSAKDKLSDDLLLPIYSLNYYKKLAVFVTINNKTYENNNGKLRGCIGTTNIDSSTIVDNTKYFSIQSAFHDSRFQPITSQEFVSIKNSQYMTYYNFNKDFSITLINKYKKSKDIHFLNTSFKIGKDVVTLKVKDRRAVYITSDYKFHGLETEDAILRMLCRKMGNNESCTDTNNAKDIEVLFQEGYSIKSELLLFNKV